MIPANSTTFTLMFLFHCRYVVGDLQKAYNTLVVAAGDSSAIKSTITDNPFEDVNYSIKEAETVCVFNLCALTEIGNTKSNLIAVSIYHALKIFFYFTQ